MSWTVPPIVCLGPIFSAVMRSSVPGLGLADEGPAAQVIRADQAGTETMPEVGEPGVEVTAAEGDVVIFPSGNVSDTRSGPEGATILVLEIVTAEDGAATPAG